MRKVCLVTGANRGLGIAVVKRLAMDGHIVFAATRSHYGISEIKANISEELANHISPLLLDVTNEQHIYNAAEVIEKSHGRCDILVNNAGVYLDDPRKAHYSNLLELDATLFEKTLQVNLVGALKLIWIVLPLMIKNGYGRIVNVSSGMGRFHDFDNMAPFYRISKTALNALTKIIACETAQYKILINAVCPGWIKTKMGGEDAPRAVEDAVEGILWACYLPSDGPNGGFFRDGQPLDWCLKG